MKPLLTRIEEELAVCVDPLRRAELLGEKGCYLARVGDIDMSIETVRALRSDFGTASTPASLVWAMIVEGTDSVFQFPQHNGNRSRAAFL